MSCFVMKPESIRQIGYTIEKIFNCYLYSKTVTITMHAVDAAGGLPGYFGGYYIQPDSLGAAFADCRTPSGDFDGEMIARELWRLNVTAYGLACTMRTRFFPTLYVNVHFRLLSGRTAPIAWTQTQTGL